MSYENMTDVDGKEYPSDIDRERAALTRGDRELLLGEAEFDSEQQRRNAEYRLRKHIKNTFLDLVLLDLTIGQDELLKAQKKYIDSVGVAPENNILSLALRMYINTVNNTQHFDGVNFDTVKFGGRGESNTEDILGDFIEGSLLQADKRLDLPDLTAVDVNISMEREEFDQDEFLHRLVHETVSESEFSMYLDKGDIHLLIDKLKTHNEVVKVTTEDMEYVFGPTDSMLLRQVKKRDAAKQNVTMEQDSEDSLGAYFEQIDDQNGDDLDLTRVIEMLAIEEISQADNRRPGVFEIIHKCASDEFDSETVINILEQNTQRKNID